MRHDQTIILRHSGTGVLTVTRRAVPWLVAISGVVAGASLTQCLSPAQAADALAIKEPGTETPLAQKPDYTPIGHEMECYKAFARQAQMPTITVTNKTTLEIDGTVKADLTRLAKLSIREKEALASKFGVPAAVIVKVVERATNSPLPDAAQLVQAMRTAVVDHKFLLEEWQRYNPPAERQKIKADALQALKVGDINKAWELYDALHRPAPPPAPPTNLRISTQP